MENIFAVILAAGKGTRMKSKHHKVLHPVCGKPMINHVIDTTQQLKPKETIVVIGHQAEAVREAVSQEVSFVEQHEQLGTGHAVMMAQAALEDKEGITLVLYGDAPLISADILQELITHHQQTKSAVSVLTALLDNPTGYGRIIRSEQGFIERIVEQKDASASELAVNEINTGIYCFDNQALMRALAKLDNNNVQQEYYLTDCIEIIKQLGLLASAYTTNQPEKTEGINDRVQLAQAEKVMQKQILEKWMREGVTIIDPGSTFIDAEVEIGMDTIIYPGSILSGTTKVGTDCHIGPHTQLINAVIGNQVTIRQSVVDRSTVLNHTAIGPFAHIRPESHVGEGCKVGNFVEIKKSTLGDGAKASHLSYIGDAEIGERVNLGCGSITVNYDGQEKHKTIIGADTFIGCNSNLIAPLTIGKNAYVAAGSTIHEEVPGDSFAIARERQTTKVDYVPAWKKRAFKK